MKWIKWIVDLIASLFGGTTASRKRASMDDLLFVAGLDYHWSEIDPKDLCAKAVAARAHAIGCELGEKMNTGPQGVITDVANYYPKKIKQFKALVEQARKSGLWVKVCFWNTNAKAGKTVSADTLKRMFDLFKREIGTDGVLVVPMSEFDGNTPNRVRADVLKYVLANWPNSQVVVMDSDSGSALWHETHLSRTETRLSGRPHFFCVTDHPVTLADNVSHETMMKCAAAVRRGGMSFHYYGFETKPNMDDWKAIGDLYA